MHNACVNASRYIYAQIYLATCFRCICIVVDMMRIICNELCKLLLESFLPCSWYASSERRSVLWCASSCCVWLIWWHKLHWRAEWNRTNVQSCCVKQHKVLFMPADLSATDVTCEASWHVSRQKMLSQTCRQHKNISHHVFFCVSNMLAAKIFVSRYFRPIHGSNLLPTNQPLRTAPKNGRWLHK